VRARTHTQVEEYEEDGNSLSQSAHESGATLYETRILPRYDALTSAFIERIRVSRYEARILPRCDS
jgi:hypothetical protein